MGGMMGGTGWNRGRIYHIRKINMFSIEGENAYLKYFELKNVRPQ